ncbi:hypothetical protein Bca101_049289 [Brassica carinata]
MSSSYVVFANLRAVCCSNTAEVRLLRFSETQERWRAYECLNVWFVLDALQSRLFHGAINLIQSGR